MTRRSCGASPTTRSPVTTPTAVEAENPYLAFFEGRRRRPGIAGRSLDARRVHPRRHEHRQHDDLRRDHRLRALRVHGRLRPGHRVQLDRSRRPLRLRQPAADRAVEPRAARPRRCCRCSTSTWTRPWRRPPTCCSRSPTATTGTGATGCAPSWASAIPNSATSELIDDLLALLHAQKVDFTLVLPGAVVVSARRRGTGPIALRRTLRLRRVGGPLAGAAVVPDRVTHRPSRKRWTGSTPSTSRATTRSRKRWPRRPTATSDRSDDCSTCSPSRSTSDPVWSRTPHRPRRASGRYRTFCGT